ncbi:MAG TPA: hypothetical protein PKE40_06145 [Arachnia sp.]|nr:hypothetical protein [Arachnia sp.]HMT85917.1 hypothetical protein [Arachnia sp.]
MFGDPESGEEAAAAPERNFRNGAEHLWTLDAHDIIEDGLWVTPYEDPRSGLDLGPIAAGDVWLAAAWNYPGGGALVGIDPARGEVLWSQTNTRWEDCVVAPDGERFLCSFADGEVSFVNAESGARRELLRISPDAYSYVGAASSGAVVVEEFGDGAVKLHGLKPDGTATYSEAFQVTDELIPIARPISVRGNQVRIETWEETLVFDLASGEQLGRFRGWVDLTGGDAVIGHDGFEVVTSSPKLSVLGSGPTQRVEVLSVGEKTLGVVDGPEGISLCIDAAFDRCTSVPGMAELWDPYAQMALREVGGRLFLIYLSYELDHEAVIDVASGTLIGENSEYFGWSPRPGADGLLPHTVDRVDWDTPWDGGQSSLRHPLTGSTLGLLPASIGTVVPVDVAPGYAVMGWEVEKDMWGGQRYLTAFAGATQPTEVALDRSAEPTSTPAGLPECPGDTFLLAWATFPNGSITVCGYYIDEPSVVVYTLDGKQTVISDVTADGAFAYRALQPGGGALRLSFESGVVEFLRPDETIEAQKRVDLIWFVALGRNRPTVAQFDVALPDATADDQARYLAELLASSKEARTSLVAANTSLLECRKGTYGDYSDEIIAIDQVTSNRAELLAAFVSAPVDLIPDGPVLLEELRISIRHSLDADLAFASWARAIQRDGCTGATTEAGVKASENATAAKKAFVAHWNDVIVPRFPVAALAYTDV